MHTVRRLILLSFLPYSERVLAECHFPALKSEGFEISYWDLSTPIWGFVQDRSEIIMDNEVRIESFTEFENLLKQHVSADTFFVIYVTFGYRFVKFWRILAKHKAASAAFGRGFLPSAMLFPFEPYSNIKNWFLGGLKRRLFSMLSIKFFEFLFKIRLLKKVDLLFVAGAIAIKKMPFANEYVDYALTDYDRWLKERREPKKHYSNEKIAVFLDNNMAYHPDIKKIGWKFPDEDVYFKSMITAFDEIEKQTGLRIVIAAHPSAIYNEGQFGKREIRKGITSELVRDSSLVLCHMSTSISYSVLYRKPIVFIDTPGIEIICNGYIRGVLYGISRYLRAPMVKVDSDYRIQINGKLGEANLERYKLYQSNYIVSDGVNYQNLDEIVVKAFKRLESKT